MANLLHKEQALGLNKLDTYKTFNNKVQIVKQQLIEFLQTAKQQAKKVVAYGAPAKGSTLLNYCSITSKLVEFTVDQNPNKQGCLLPGSHIPIYHPNKIFETHPDYLLILPWNLKDEIMTDMHDIQLWGGKFVVPIPNVQVMMQ